jgi:hypothetical protein
MSAATLNATRRHDLFALLADRHGIDLRPALARVRDLLARAVAFAGALFVLAEALLVERQPRRRRPAPDQGGALVLAAVPTPAAGVAVPAIAAVQVVAAVPDAAVRTEIGTCPDSRRLPLPVLPAPLPLPCVTLLAAPTVQAEPEPVAKAPAGKARASAPRKPARQPRPRKTPAAPEPRKPAPPEPRKPAPKARGCKPAAPLQPSAARRTSEPKLTAAEAAVLAELQARPEVRNGEAFNPLAIFPRTARGNAQRQAVRRLARKGLLVEVSKGGLFHQGERFRLPPATTADGPAAR